MQSAIACKHPRSLPRPACEWTHCLHERSISRQKSTKLEKAADHRRKRCARGGGPQSGGHLLINMRFASASQQEPVLPPAARAAQHHQFRHTAINITSAKGILRVHTHPFFRATTAPHAVHGWGRGHNATLNHGHSIALLLSLHLCMSPHTSSSQGQQMYTHNITVAPRSKGAPSAHSKAATTAGRPHKCHQPSACMPATTCTYEHGLQGKPRPLLFVDTHCSNPSACINMNARRRTGRMALPLSKRGRCGRAMPAKPHHHATR